VHHWASGCWETLDGPLSDVSTATITRIGAIFSFFRDLQDQHKKKKEEEEKRKRKQDQHTFAPLQTQHFNKKSSIFCVFKMKMKSI